MHSMKKPEPFQMGRKNLPAPSHEVLRQQHSWVLAMHHILFGLGRKAHVRVLEGKCLQSFIPQPYFQPDKWCFGIVGILLNFEILAFLKLLYRRHILYVVDRTLRLFKHIQI